MYRLLHIPTGLYHDTYVFTSKDEIKSKLSVWLDFECIIYIRESGEGFLFNVGASQHTRKEILWEGILREHFEIVDV